MEPRYHPGEIIYVHPHKAVMVGSYVLVQMRTKTEGEQISMLIKRLVKKGRTRIVLQQFNPVQLFDIALNDIDWMHRIVGSSE